MIGIIYEILNMTVCLVSYLYQLPWHLLYLMYTNWCRFKGSTFQVMGLDVSEGEWAIVGGTGQFCMATGVIYKKFHSQLSEGNIVELTIHGFCPVLKGSRVRIMFIRFQILIKTCR